MTISFTCGSAAILYWYVFNETAEEAWKLSWTPSGSLREVRGGSLKDSTDNPSDLILTKPIYLDYDADCCPTGGSTAYVLRWRDNQFVATQTLESPHSAQAACVFTSKVSMVNKNDLAEAAKVDALVSPDGSHVDRISNTPLRESVRAVGLWLTTRTAGFDPSVSTYRQIIIYISFLPVAACAKKHARRWRTDIRHIQRELTDSLLNRSWKRAVVKQAMEANGSK